MLRRARIGAVILLALLPSGAAAEQVVADLSRHLVAITTGFTGSNVLLFGTMEGTGDVIVIVRGPPADITVRRKGRVAGVWVNQEGMTFEGVPAFYAVAATRDIDEILSGQAARTYRIGASWLRPANWERLNPDRRIAFLNALIRQRQRVGLYPPELGNVRFPGEGLFRTTVHFPANVPTGSYTVQVLVVRDGIVVGGQTTPLFVNKIGISAEVFDFAQYYSWAYGLIAIVLAAAAGWFAEWAFRRR